MTPIINTSYILIARRYTSGTKYRTVHVGTRRTPPWTLRSPPTRHGLSTVTHDGCVDCVCRSQKWHLPQSSVRFTSVEDGGKANAAGPPNARAPFTPLLSFSDSENIERHVCRSKARCIRWNTAVAVAAAAATKLFKLYLSVSFFNEYCIIVYGVHFSSL